MKKHIHLILLIQFSYQVLFSQTWLSHHSSISLPNIPAKSSFSTLIGANGGNAIGQSSMPNAGTIKTMRNFHHMEIDYRYNFFPMDGILNANTCSCANVWCNNGGCTDIMQANGTKSGFTSTKGFYCNWAKPSFGFTEMYASLESLFPKYQPAGCSPTTITRSYPNKWYSITEFGGLNNAAQNFKNYVTAFLITNCPNDTTKPALVNVLEIGNEPWGDPYPGKDGYHQLLIGAVSACRDYYGSNNPKNWRIQLSLAAFQADHSGPSNFGAVWTYVDNMIPDSLKQYFNYANIHNYAFNKSNFNLGVIETPESDSGNFLTVKNIIEWRNQKMTHAKVNVTEFGWNAGTLNDGCGGLGESTQAAYTMRAFMVTSRYDVHKAFVYAFVDNNEYPLYCTTGLFKDIGNNVQRKAYKCIQTIQNSNYKNDRFLKALSEKTDQANNGQNGKFVYLIGDANGTPTHIVAWKPVKLTFEDNNYPTVATNYDTIILPNTGMTVSNTTPYSYMGWDNSQNGTVSNNASATVDIAGTASNIVHIKLSGMPIVIPINANGCKYDSAGVLTGCLTTAINTTQESIINMYHSSENEMVFINTGSYVGNVGVKIYDMMGRIVYNNTYNASGSHSFNFEGKSLGVYMAEVMLNDGNIIIKKIVTK